MEAVYGKHIRIVNPLGSMYYNYEGYVSVVLMALLDSNYCFMYVHTGSYGKDGDSYILRKSVLLLSFWNSEWDLPDDKCLPEMTDCHIFYSRMRHSP